MSDQLRQQLVDDLKKEDPIEILRCAQANFKNISDRLPGIGLNPIWQIATAQLDAVLANLAEARK